jgi:hypothetical protein
MKRTKLRHISPISLAKNLALLFFCFGVIASIVAALAWLLGPGATLGGPVRFTEEASRSPLVWFLNPLLIAAYGYLTGLLGAWFFNLVADHTGGLVYYLESGNEADDRN